SLPRITFLRSACCPSLPLPRPPFEAASPPTPPAPAPSVPPQRRRLPQRPDPLLTSLEAASTSLHLGSSGGHHLRHQRLQLLLLQCRDGKGFRGTSPAACGCGLRQVNGCRSASGGGRAGTTNSDGYCLPTGAAAVCLLLRPSDNFVDACLAPAPWPCSAPGSLRPRRRWTTPGAATSMPAPRSASPSRSVVACSTTTSS
ncbi:unnamed protein product, partial [Urochloa humidicola]